MATMTTCDAFHTDWDLTIVAMSFGYPVGMDNTPRVSSPSSVLSKRDNLMMSARTSTGMVTGAVSTQGNSAVVARLCRWSRT